MFLNSHFRKKQQIIIVLNGNVNFDPATTVSGGGFQRWDLGDGTLLPRISSFIHPYGDTSIYTVLMNKRDRKKILSLNINNDDLLSMDLTHMVAIQGSNVWEQNSNLTTVIFPIQLAGNPNITVLDVSSCDLTGVVDVSGLLYMQGTTRFDGNPNMTDFIANGISLSTVGAMSFTELQNNASLVNLDISGWTRMTGVLQFRTCADLANVTMPNNVGISVGAHTVMNGYSNPSLTGIDFSNYENVSGTFSFYGNTVMASILLPAAPTNDIGNIRIGANANLAGVVDWSAFTSIGTQLRFETCPNLTGFIPPQDGAVAGINLLWGYNNGSINSLDFSSIDIVRGSILLYNCATLTSVIFNPVAHSSAITALFLRDNDLTGTLDLTMFEGLGGTAGIGNFDIHNNPNLTQIDHAASPNDIDNYEAFDCNLTGVHDISMLTGLNFDVKLNGNANLTGILVPVTTAGWTFFFAYDCDLTGTLDTTGITGGFRQLNIHNNPNLTGFVVDPLTVMSGGDGQTYQMQDCNLTGTLDLSKLNKMGGTFWAFGNANLRVINYPTSTVLLDDVRLENCDLTGVMDWSTMNISTDVMGGSNPNLTGILNPTNSNNFALYSFSSCGITFVDMTPLSGLFDSVGCTTSFNACAFSVASVNQMLVDFDTNSAGAIAGRSLNLAGAGMGIPDAVTGGNDGLAAKASLIVKGYTVTTN